MKYSTRKLPVENIFGAVTTYQCLPNYWIKRGITNTSVSCNKFGVWSNITRKCIRESFPQFLKPFYKCTLQKRSNIREYYDVNYSKNISYCVVIYYSVIKCPFIPIWDDMEVNTTKRTVDTMINISCFTEEDQTKQIIITQCTSDGDWKPPIRCKGNTTNKLSRLSQSIPVTCMCV